jgi:recombination protein RecA
MPPSGSTSGAIASIQDGDEIVGNRTKAKIVKNKVAPPFREAEFDILYGQGISREGDLLDIAVEKNVVDKSGAWFSFQGERLGQGRDNARQFLKDNHDYRGRVELALREIMGLSIPTVPPGIAAAAGASENGSSAKKK